MKLIKTTLAMTLSGLLVACGGGGSEGYYNSNNGSNNNTTSPTPSTPEVSEGTQETFNALKQEAASIFGHTDSEQKGYVDHAMDTYVNGILKLSQDIRNVDLTLYKNEFYYKSKCFEKSTTDNRGCYVFVGNEIKDLLSDEYENWDFEITDEHLKDIRLKSDEITPDLDSYKGATYILIFENSNPLKHLQDISIAGSFAYPYEQESGLQKRFILINEETSDFQITVTPYDSTESTVMGALSIYKVPNTTDESEYYVTEAGSGFNTLINDNTNVAYAEPINFRIDSTPGVAPSTYKILNGIETLNLPSVSISGTRVEHENPSLNDKEFIGSIYLQGPNILNFKASALNSVLKFKHIFNDITYEGESKNTADGVVTTFISPSNIKY